MYCTHCGEKNPAGSSRCAQCARPLAPLPGPGAPVGRRCPMCGQVNTVDAVFCAQCAARVVPMADVNEDELDILHPSPPPPPPLSPDAQIALNHERQHELFTTGEDRPLDPDLARRLTASPEPPSHSLFGTRAARSAGAPLSWLDALRGDTDQPAPGDGALAPSTPHAPAAPAREEPALPAWLNAPAAAMPTREEPALPAWLNAPAAAPREQVVLPAWMSGPSPAPASPALAPPAAPAPAAPAALAGPAPTPAAPAAPAPAPAAPAAPQVALPPWLRNAAAPPPAAPPAPATPEAALLPRMAGPAEPPVAPPTAPDGLPAWMTPRAEPPPPESAAATVDGLPAWMTPPAEPPPPESAAPVDGLPAWMSPPVVAAPESAAAVDGLPAWMSPPAQPPPESAATVEARPAWMSSPAQPPPPESATAVEARPAWMSPPAEQPSPESAVASVQELPAAPPTTASNMLGDIELPAWLRAVAAASPPPLPLRGRRPITSKLPPLEEELLAAHAPATPAGPSGAAAPGVPTEGDEGLPAWLNEPETAGAAAAIPVPAAPAPEGDEGLPAWLSGPVAVPEVPAALDAAALDASGQVASESTSAPPAAASAAPAGDIMQNAGDLPAWLRAIQAAPAPAVPPTPQPVSAPEEDIPAWLRALGSVEDELAPGAALDAASGPPIAATRIFHARPPRAGAVAVFQRLLEPPSAPVVAPAARRSILSRLFTDRLVHLLLLATVVAMWALAPQALDLNTATAPPTPEGGTFYDTLTRLPANAPVLLVYDWDATRYGEMHPLSVAVTRVLSATGHTLATISTLPEGTGFALQVTAEIMPGAPDAATCSAISGSAPGPWPGAYGTRFLHLGYLPGNEAGLAQLATSNLVDVQPYDLVCNHGMQRAPLLTRAPSLSQFGAIVLLAGGDLPLRLWIEQVASHVQVPVLAALPESLRTAAAPYLNLEGGNARLRAAVFGVAGAQEIAQRLDESSSAGAAGTADRATLGRFLHTESAALFFLALALLIGFISGIYRWINRRSAT